MKKFILSIYFLLCMFSIVSAQRAEERKEEIRKGLHEQVKLTDEQITSVVSIENEYRPKLKAVKTDANLSDEDKKEKTKALNEEKLSKITSLLGKDKAIQVQAFYSQLKKNKKGAVRKKTGIPD